MDYFRPINKFGEALGVWSFNGKLALRIGVPNPMSSSNSHVILNDGENLFDAMSRQLRAFFEHGKPCIIKYTELKPGQYYPRIARPNDQHPNDYPIYPAPEKHEHELAVSKGQLGSLLFRLQQIFQTVHPTENTYLTYGHEIRNLLILACTEVEAQWKGILEANQYTKERYATNDYVKLNKVMRLNEYAVTLPHYPSIKEISPFLDWNENDPTKSLIGITHIIR